MRGRVAQHHGPRVARGVIGDLHELAPYRLNWVVAYSVTTSGGALATSLLPVAQDLGEEAVHGGGERPHVLGRDPPDDVAGYGRVLVPEDVADRGDVAPRNLGMACLHRRRHAPGSLRDDLDIALDRLTQHRFAIEILALPRMAILLDQSDGFSNVLEVEPQRPVRHQ